MTPPRTFSEPIACLFVVVCTARASITAFMISLDKLSGDRGVIAADATRAKATAAMPQRRHVPG